jgi:hypothetical protein
VDGDCPNCLLDEGLGLRVHQISRNR